MVTINNQWEKEQKEHELKKNVTVQQFIAKQINENSY